jgi:hypothetical protein
VRSRIQLPRQPEAEVLQIIYKGLRTETHFYVGAFDRAAELQPTRHVFANEHLPRVHMDN